MQSRFVSVAQYALFGVSACLFSTAQARPALLSPSFTEDQEQVRILTGRNQGLVGAVASLFGITEARLLGEEQGRYPYYVAQYMTYLESERSNDSPDTKQFVRKTLRDREWAFAVLRPFQQEAREKNNDLCDVRLDHVSCLYFVLSQDMRLRVKLWEDAPRAK